MKENLDISKKIESMTELKICVQELVYKENGVVIPWNHIKQHHPNITGREILNGLIYGFCKPDKNIDGRYISWSKFTSPVRLIRIVFEVHENADTEYIHVITAFEEE